MRHRAVLVDEREHCAREEGAEDHLEPERLGEGDEADQEQEGAAHADLRSRVLKPK